jgi:hypothetical protein
MLQGRKTGTSPNRVFPPHPAPGATAGVLLIYQLSADGCSRSSLLLLGLTAILSSSFWPQKEAKTAG